VFPSAPELGEANFVMYHRILGDLDAATIDAAALQFAATHIFFPSAGELREAAMALVEQAKELPSVEEAWAEVSKSFGGHRIPPNPAFEGKRIRIHNGRDYIEPEWSDPIIGKVILSLGGWRMLCLSDNYVADRAHFYKAYKALIDRERESTRMLPAVKRIVEKLTSERKWITLMDGKGE
jgi:hypothetical protein